MSEQVQDFALIVVCVCMLALMTTLILALCGVLDPRKMRDKNEALEKKIEQLEKKFDRRR